MNNRDKQQKIWLVLGVAVTIILLFFVFQDALKNRRELATLKTEIAKQTNYNNNSSSSLEVKAPIIPSDTTAFRAEVPKDIVVPEVGTNKNALSDKEIVVPTTVTPAAPGVESKFRVFNIRAEQGVFNPSKVIARVGDTVHINFTAVDKDYDIVFPSYNMMQQAKSGQTKTLEFQALQEGAFVYYCDSCGGAEGKTKGQIIIVKQ